MLSIRQRGRGAVAMKSYRYRRAWDNVRWLVAAVLLMAVAIVFDCFIASGVARSAVYLTNLGLIVAFYALVGEAINKRLDGVFIDNRNRVSLSKLQMLIWFAVVLAFLVTAAVENAIELSQLKDGFSSTIKNLCSNLSAACQATGITSWPASMQAFLIYIPPEIIAATGIAVGSGVATPVLLSLKANVPSTNAQTLGAAVATNVPPSQVSARGQVYGRAQPQYASWADIFQGDDLGNAGSPDVSKIQQALITLFLIALYITQILYSLGSEQIIVSAPAISSQFIWLMGVSHASYLAYKAAPHSTPSS